MKNRRSWHSASKAEWKEACRREAVIRPLVVEGSVSNARADQAAKELGVSRSLVYRLVARYRQRAQTSSLLSIPRGRTEQTQWLDKEVETLNSLGGRADLPATRAASGERPVPSHQSRLPTVWS